MPAPATARTRLSSRLGAIDLSVVETHGPAAVDDPAEGGDDREVERDVERPRRRPPRGRTRSGASRSPGDQRADDVRGQRAPGRSTAEQVAPRARTGGSVIRQRGRQLGDHGRQRSRAGPRKAAARTTTMNEAEIEIATTLAEVDGHRCRATDRGDTQARCVEAVDRTRVRAGLQARQRRRTASRPRISR